MSTMQIRDVPDSTRRVLKARAAASGQSLSEYLLAQLNRAAEQPTLAELTERIRARGREHPRTPAADVLADERPGTPS